MVPLERSYEAHLDSLAGTQECLDPDLCCCTDEFKCSYCLAYDGVEMYDEPFEPLRETD